MIALIMSKENRTPPMECTDFRITQNLIEQEITAQKPYYSYIIAYRAYKINISSSIAATKELQPRIDTDLESRKKAQKTTKYKIVLQRFMSPL